DPVIVNVAEQASAGTALVTIGDVASVVGGDAATRYRIARIDIAELKPREQNATVGRRAIEYRLQLAGIDPLSVQMMGAESTAVSATRRPVTTDEVLAVARAELVHRLGVSPENVSIELIHPIVVKMPEVPTRESVSIVALPHSRVLGFGRVQMD